MDSADERRSGGYDAKSNSQLSMEPRREVSRGRDYDDTPNLNKTVDQSVLLADKKELDMHIDSIIDEKAFIWACGRNTDGELAFGPVNKSSETFSLPKNVKQLRDFPIRMIQGSNNHTVLMTPQGDVHVSGSTLHGKLGILGIEKKGLNKFHVVTQLQGMKVI